MVSWPDSMSSLVNWLHYTTLRRMEEVFPGGHHKIPCDWCNIHRTSHDRLSSDWNRSNITNTGHCVWRRRRLQRLLGFNRIPSFNMISKQTAPRLIKADQTNTWALSSWRPSNVVASRHHGLSRVDARQKQKYWIASQIASRWWRGSRQWRHDDVHLESTF